MEDEAHQKKKLEEEIIILRSQLLQLNYEADQVLLLLSQSAEYVLLIIVGLDLESILWLFPDPFGARFLNNK